MDGKWGEGYFKYYTYKGNIQETTSRVGGGHGGHGGPGGPGGQAVTTRTDSETGAAIETKTIEKGTESIDLGPLSAGTKVGFAFYDRGEDEWNFKFTDDGKYQNGGRDYYTYSAADGEKLVNFNQTSYSGGRSNSDWDDWMAISASATVASSHAPAGAPLPGVLAVLLVGGAGAGMLKKFRSRH